jgi:hypothetical protein
MERASLGREATNKVYLCSFQQPTTYKLAANMQVNVPEFYIAFVLSDTTKPSTDDYEKLRIATQKHLLERLVKTHPTISSLDLEIHATEYGESNPEPRFQVFVEAKVTILFPKSQPEPKDLLESLLVLFDRAYLMDSVRPIQSPFASAVEVQARRLKRPTMGGAVKAPAFYMAFVCADKPTGNPSSVERELLQKLTHQEASKQLRKQFGDAFSALSIHIVKMEVNEEAGKPEPKFNYYVEFEATATFSQDTPTPFELFQALSNVTNIEFIHGVHAVGGSLRTLTLMVVRICIFIELPELVEVDAGDDLGEAPIIKVHVEFFIALVVRALYAMPSKNQLTLFDDCISSFFPLPRFNMLHQYNATLEFHEPAPNEMSVLSKFLQGKKKKPKSL